MCLFVVELYLEATWRDFANDEVAVVGFEYERR